jgi:hypothetical protein
LFKKTEAASLAATVTYQTTAEPDVLRNPLELLLAMPKEKSSTLIDQAVLHANHTPELKEETLSASQTNAVPTKLLLG